ncbi:unnamed protein product [Rotaria sp. Silwood1]|nr:unnamed protein product [Rotaria sp. Silwood1]
MRLMSRNISQTIVRLTYENITNSAGRHWTFVFGSKHDSIQTIVNHTFTVTLDPLPLKSLPSFDVTLNEELTTASVFVPNCDQVAETKYLNFRCGINNDQQKPLPNNCVFTCSVNSSSVYNTSLIRLPIPRHNGTESFNDTFRMDQRIENIRIAILPVLYQQTWLPNMTHISVNVIPQSDFYNVETICKAKEEQKPVCTDMNKIHEQCSTTLTLRFNSTRGCDYQCFFSTKKQGFTDAHSSEFTMSISPPKPIIISSTWAARYISVYWTIDEPTYVHQFSVIVNGKRMLVSDRRSRSFNYTKNILPNRKFHLSLFRLNIHIVFVDYFRWKSNSISIPYELLIIQNQIS